jgi:hypothetical protein
MHQLIAPQFNKSAMAECIDAPTRACIGVNMAQGRVGADMLGVRDVRMVSNVEMSTRGQ